MSTVKKNLSQTKVQSKVRPNDHTHELQIGGMPYRLKSTHSPQMVEEIARIVDSKLNAAMKTSKNGSFQSAAVLAALNLAEELVVLRREALKELDFIESKTLKVSQILEEIQNPQPKLTV